MLFGKLFHTAIKTADLDATVRFYTEVLGMVVAADYRKATGPRTGSRRLRTRSPWRHAGRP